jgi:hypothetical protein
MSQVDPHMVTRRRAQKGNAGGIHAARAMTVDGLINGGQPDSPDRRD